jgi:CBS domain-containing protein
MTIKDIMSMKVEVVSPETPLHEVARKMLATDCGSVLVSKDDRLVGVITDRDMVLRCIAEARNPVETRAEQVMTTPVLYCRDSDTMEDVALDMTKNMVRRLPVLDKNKRLVGIVSLGDLAVHSIDEHHRICGKALGHICAVPLKPIRAESEKKVAHA